MKTRNIVIILLCCICFGMLYYYIGSALTRTEIYNYDGLLFHADTAEVAEDITQFQTPSHGDTNVHPLFVLLVNPLGLLLSSLVSSSQAIVILHSIIGVLVILTAHAFFRHVGVPPFQAMLWCVLTGFAACNLIFVSIPERHIAASLSITVMCLFAVKYAGRIGAFLPAGILTLGITVTNFFQCVILFTASLIHKISISTTTWKKILTRTILFGVATLIIAIGLSVIQSLIWPDSRFFFIPGVYKEEATFFLFPTTMIGFVSKLALLVSHMFAFNITAPAPLIQSETLTYGLASYTCYPLIGRISLLLWIIIITMSIISFAKGNRRWAWIQAGILMCLAFNIVIHMIYGDDFFIYSVNWTFPVIALVALSFFEANASAGKRLVHNAVLSCFVLSLVTNNCLFISDVSSYLLGNGSAKWKQWHHEQWLAAQDLGSFLKEHDIRIVYGDSSDKWISYAIDNSSTVVDLAHELSRPQRIKAELTSRKYAILNNCGKVDDFIRNTGGSCSKEQRSGYVVYYNIRPPTNDLHSVTLSNAQASSGLLRAKSVIDNNIDTFCSQSPNKENDPWITLDLDGTREISCVRLFPGKEGYPVSWRVEGKAPDSSDWIPLTPSMKNCLFFWSGPRLYWGGKQFFLEARFEPIHISAVRIVFPGSHLINSLAVSEIQAYSSTPRQVPDQEIIRDILDLIETKQITRLYSERWIANESYRRFGSKISVETEPRVFNRQLRGRFKRPIIEPSHVYLAPGTAVLCRSDNTATTAKCFQSEKIPMKTTRLGSWTLFEVDSSSWYHSNPGYCRLDWNGISCFRSEPNWATKEYSAELTKAAELLKDQPARQDERILLLNKALAFYPDFQGALLQLSDTFRAGNNEAGLAVVQSKLSALQDPKVIAQATFSGMISLRGLSFDKTDLSPGSPFTVRYYWETSVKESPHTWAVFVHFRKDDKTIFQGDHVFCEAYSPREVAFQPYHEIFAEDLALTIPEGIPVGAYEVRLGIYNRKTGKRLKVRSKLPTDKESVTLPVLIKIE